MNGQQLKLTREKKYEKSKSYYQKTDSDISHIPFLLITFDSAQLKPRKKNPEDEWKKKPTKTVPRLSTFQS